MHRVLLSCVTFGAAVGLLVLGVHALFSQGPGRSFVSDGVFLLCVSATLALTATVQYDLWKNVISRLELRWDHSLNGHLFGGESANSFDDETGTYSSSAHLKNAWMLAANVIYKF